MQKIWAQLVQHSHTAHLLPAVPPEATLAPGSALRAADRGKVPGQRLADGTWVGFTNWSEHHASEEDVRRWSQWGGNVALILRTFRAVDIDCEHPAQVNAILRLLELRYGILAVRRRCNSSRCMVFFRAPPDMTGKLRLEWDGGKLEFLGLGCQAIIYGRHPSGVDYEWHGLCSPAEAPPEAFPLLPEADIPEILQAVQAALEGLRAVVQPPSRLGGTVTTLKDRRPIGDPGMVARDIEQAGRALQAIPNRFTSYDDVFKILAAYYGAVGGDAVAIDTVLIPWLESWEGGTNSPEWIAERINSLSSGTSAGADQLFRCAREWGWTEVPAGVFEKIEPEATVIDFETRRAKAREAVADAQAARMDMPGATLLGNPWTDHQVAKTVWEDYGAHACLRLHPNGQWLYWNGIAWLEDADEAHHCVRVALSAIARRVPEGKENKAITHWLESSGRAPAVLDVLKKTTKQWEWDSRPELLNTPGGLYNLRTGEKRAVRADDYIRSITPVAPDFGYPSTYMGATLEIFDGDVVAQGLWNDWVALCLLGMLVTGKILVLDGSGRNGKSMLLDVIRTMMGAYCYRTANPDAFDTRKSTRTPHAESLAVLDGKRAGLFTEVDKHFVADEALLKAAVMGEEVEASRKYRSKFNFCFTASLTFAANVEMAFTSSPAMRSRVHTLHLTRRFELDHKFYASVLADAPRVLGWCIGRCVEILSGAETFWLPDSWAKQTLEFKRLQRASEERFALSDPIGMVVAALVARKSGGHISTKELNVRVKQALECMRESWAEEATALEEACAMTEISRERKVAAVMRSEFGVRPTQRRAAGNRTRGYHGVALILHPHIPFT